MGQQGGDGWGSPPGSQGNGWGQAPGPGVAPQAPPDPYGNASAPLAAQQSPYRTPPPVKGPGWFGQMMDSGYQPDAEEMQQAFHAHLFSGLAAILFCGMIFPVGAPLLVMAMAKEKRPFMLYHINQAVMFQAAIFVFNSAMGIIGGILAIFCVGYLLLALIPVAVLGSAIFAFVVGSGAKSGAWNEYPVVGQKLLREWKPLFT